jgi:uncharacterized protein YdhG (YjbR/CyaY superfamily)
MPRADVDTWFAQYENPMKSVVQRVREIILAADPRIDECIKWQAPTFTYLGNLASFFPKSKTHASLMFHDGANIPGTYRRLEGDGDKGRVMKFASMADAEAAKAELTKLVRAWCEWRESRDASTAPSSKSAAARKGSGRKRA